MPITLTGIRGVVFDLDDTLYPEHAYVRSGFTAVGAFLRSRMDCPSDPAERLWAMFESGARGRLFDELLAEWQSPRPAELIPDMIACYRQHEPVLCLHEDAHRALDRWKSHFLLGLVTDGPLTAQRRKIQALGLGPLLAPIICTDQWGREFWKPHPRAFDEIERAWQLRGAACLYIADNPAKDFVAPNLLSWRSIQVRRPKGEYDSCPAAPAGAAEFEVASLDDIVLNS